MKRQFRFAALLLAALLAFSGCGKTTGPAPSQTPTEPAVQQPETPQQTPAEPSPLQPETTQEQPAKEPANAVIGFAEDILQSYPEFIEYAIDTGEFSCDVVFAADADLSNVAVLGLTYRDTDASGRILFDTEELYTESALSAGKALLLHLTFIGDIPNYGISYTDTDGSLRRFAIGESGFDGSLFLEEF
ncbi:MAG: hypothetical protein HUJ80_03805 [Firmicutes bacterium]|nr:hypothetical protein [Bacillota bacterium]